VTIVHQLLTPGEAQRLTQRIKLTAGAIRDNLWKLRNLVEEAKQSNAWQILGFASWTAYLADTLADEPMRLGREERQELVGYLSGEGLSTRAIAPIVGASHMQVKRDIDAGVTNVTPAEPETEFDPTPILPPHDDDWIAADPATGEVVEADHITVTEHTVTEKVKTVTGLDGKTYPAAAPTAPRRSSLIDDARNAGWQLRKAIERLERIHQDDRFTKNKVEILAALQPHLDFATETISGL
jgi:hypothetical protein